jgi:hypothetical protein
MGTDEIGDVVPHGLNSAAGCFINLLAWILGYFSSRDSKEHATRAI